MKEGEQSSFLTIIDNDPVMSANALLYEREAVMKRARERRANREERRRLKKEGQTYAAQRKATLRYENQMIKAYDSKRFAKSELQMRVFRLDTEITDMKVELAGLISQARARALIMQDIEWRNC